LRWLASATVQGDMNDRYSTSRNSTTMASIWVKRLSLKQILEIEEIVGNELMEFFDYPRILDLIQQSDTL